MSGYVARVTGAFSIEGRRLQFLMDKKDLRKEKIFESREECIRFFREEMHYATDDLKYIIWFESGEDEKRNLLTGELLESKRKEENYDDITDLF